MLSTKPSISVLTPLRLIRFKSIIILLLLVFSTGCETKDNDHKKKLAPVILISIDGFRFDYFEKFQPPNLLALIETGVKAEQMLPSYPTKTFPNHISIVTGMYPSNHGLVHNTFYDQKLNDIYKMGKAYSEPRWMQATPIWIHAERHGVRTASYFWPESDSTLEGLKASYSYRYNKQTPYSNRIDQILEWLKLPEADQPRLITSYFSAVDDAGHYLGTNSQELRDAVLNVDHHVGNLVQRIKKELAFDVNIIIVSDHGMVNVDPSKNVEWETLADFSEYKVLNGSTQLMLYGMGNTTPVDNSLLVKDINSQSEGRYKAFLKEDIPTNLNYFNNERIPDVIVDSNPPVIFVSKPLIGNNRHSRVFNGMHGYDPYRVPEMGAIFIANGPAFKKGLIIPPFENIHVFPLLTEILELPPKKGIDGKLDVLETVLN